MREPLTRSQQGEKKLNGIKTKNGGKEVFSAIWSEEKKNENWWG